MVNIQERFELIKRNTQEIVKEDELKKLLKIFLIEIKTDGFEISKS